MARWATASAQPDTLDTGKFAHQIRVTPDNSHVILVTRGNNAPTDNPVDPGSIKIFGFKDGVLTNLAAIQPGDGMHFGPRHLDFHPTQPWVYVSVESQNQLYVYKRDAATGLSREPLYVKDTLSDPASKLRQAAGPDPRQSRRALCLSHQPRLVVDRVRGQAGVFGRRELGRGLRHRSDHRRADADPERRRTRQLPAHLRDRSSGADPRRRVGLADADARRQGHHHASRRHRHVPHRRRRQAHLRAQIRHRRDHEKAAVLGRMVTLA